MSAGPFSANGGSIFTMPRTHRFDGATHRHDVGMLRAIFGLRSVSAEEKECRRFSAALLTFCEFSLSFQKTSSRRKTMRPGIKRMKEDKKEEVEEDEEEISGLITQLI